MKKIIGILAIFILLLVLGCVDNPVEIPSDPKEAFVAFVEKSNSLDNYYTEYVTTMQVGGQEVLSNIKSYSKGDKQKSIISMNMGGGTLSLMNVNFELYVFGEENTVMCMDPNSLMASSSLMAFGSATQIDPEVLKQDLCIVVDKSATASLTTLSAVPDNFDYLLNNDLEYVGKKVVAGKYNCHEYSLKMSYLEILAISSGADQESLSYPLNYDDLNVEYHICFEEKTGVLAELYYDINFPQSNTYSSYGMDNSSSVNLTLKDFRLGVTDAELAPQTKLAMSSSMQSINCADNIVSWNFSLLEETNSLNVSVKESNNSSSEVYSKTISVSPIVFESQKLEVDFGKELWDTTLVSVCNGNSCIKGVCNGNGYVPYSGISSAQAKATWKSSEPLAIIDWAQTGSKLTLVLRNNSAQTIEFNKFYLTTMGELSEKADLDEDYNNASKSISSGATYTINIITSDYCEQGDSFTYPKEGISIDYNTANINNKTQMALADIVGTCN